MNCLRCVLLISLLLTGGCGDDGPSGWHSPIVETITADGDINGDSIVDHSDALLAQRFALGLSQPSSEQLARGDLYTDGQIDISDHLLIQRLALGI